MQLPTCGLVEGERYLHVAPLYHGAGITLMNAMTIVAGTNVVLGAFEPGAVRAAIERERITADGWLHTGDIARRDPDGSMTIVDRLRDMIISGGCNVYSVEVENAVAAHPAILDCAVIGRPHEDWGESIVAVVTLHDGAALELADLREHCRARIADYKIPHHLVLGEIPRNPSGKILKTTCAPVNVPPIRRFRAAGNSGLTRHASRACNPHRDPHSRATGSIRVRS